MTNQVGYPRPPPTSVPPPGRRREHDAPAFPGLRAWFARWLSNGYLLAPTPEKVQLVTALGENVVQLKLSRFRVGPEMLRWGSRFFFRVSADTYREGFLHHVGGDPSDTAAW